MITNNYMVILFIFFTILSFLKILYSDHVLNKFFKMIYRRDWLLSFGIIILWVIFIIGFNGQTPYFNINEKDIDRFKISTQKAILAFIIAVFAYLEITIPTFWLVFLIAYYLGEIV